eukprot:9099620-Pyramimonas_sp.AAC.1
MTAQPRECYDNVNCSEHCCKACQGSCDRRDNDDITTHDDGALNTISSRTTRPTLQKGLPRNWGSLAPEWQGR